MEAQAGNRSKAGCSVSAITNVCWLDAARWILHLEVPPGALWVECCTPDASAIWGAGQQETGATGNQGPGNALRLREHYETSSRKPRASRSCATRPEKSQFSLTERYPARQSLDHLPQGKRMYSHLGEQYSMASSTCEPVAGFNCRSYRPATPAAKPGCQSN